MSKSPKRINRSVRQFPFHDDIYARVRFMLPFAAEVIADGIDDHRCEWSEHFPATEVAGLSDEQGEELMRWSAAVYAAGIAVGLRLNASLFDRGGHQS